MAISFRELPAPIQALVYLAVAAAIFLAGEFVPGSPIQQVRSEVETAKKQVASLQSDVQKLQVYERQSAQLKADIDALQKQLDTLKTIVPDEKEVDEFIHAMHDSAKAANISLRRLTAKPITPHDYFFEVPFEVEVDGPYYQVVDFFTRLSHLSRIINVGDIDFANPEEGRASHRYPMRAGTTVVGTFTATTFFTGGTTAPAAAAAGKGPAGKAPTGVPGRR
jgi:type IV pilus assembly protein PilO